MKKATTTAAPSKPVKEAPSKPAKKAPARRAPEVSAPAPKPKVAAAPVASTTRAPAARKTTVAATIDVGFGNLLYLRGEGPGLSWERGLPMDCVSADNWAWTTTAASRPFAYKVLINDEQWSLGEDCVAEVGVTNTISPTF